MNHRVIWFTGHSGSGKSILATALHQELPSVLLDDGEMRASISLGTGFSKCDHRHHNLRVARLAAVLSQQTTVIVSVIAPIASVRGEIDRICRPFWVYMKRTLPDRPGHFYEEPSGEDSPKEESSLREHSPIKEHSAIKKCSLEKCSPEYLTLDADNLTVHESLTKILTVLVGQSMREPNLSPPVKCSLVKGMFPLGTPSNKGVSPWGTQSNRKAFPSQDIYSTARGFESVVRSATPGT